MSHLAHRRSPALVALVTALALLPACGGGGTSTPGPDPTQSLTILGDASRDGYVEITGGAFALAGSAGSQPSKIGDDGGFSPSTRQFFSFDLPTLPAGATIQSATLRILQESVSGAPYTQISGSTGLPTHGVVTVDHLVYDVLDSSDFNLAPLTPNIGTLSTTTTIEVKTLVVTTQVLADRAAARTRSQFRVRWANADDDGDGVADNARYTDTEDLAATGNPPRLVITYTLP